MIASILLDSASPVVFAGIMGLAVLLPIALAVLILYIIFKIVKKNKKK